MLGTNPGLHIHSEFHPFAFGLGMYELDDKEQLD